MDFILNGQGMGSTGAVLAEHDFDPRALRPFLNSDGRSCVEYIENGKVKHRLTNAPATLRKDEWLDIDRTVIQVAKDRLKMFGDLRSSGLTYKITNGMGTMNLEHETESDITPAQLSMDGLEQSQGDQPVYDLKSLPLPIVHKDFSFSLRRIAASRKIGSPIDTTTAGLAARRCAEEVEKLTAGTGSYAYGGGVVYGYANMPERATGTLTTPTGVATNATTLSQVLDMRQQSKDMNYHGPWKLYCSPLWARYLDDDYSAAKGDITLRERLMKIAGIQAVEDADYLQNHDMILVQQSVDVARAVVAMEITTLQWPTMGGMKQNFKVMGILVPQVRADANDNTGIVHYSV